MALFAIRNKTEAASRSWPPELDTKKSAGGLLAPTSAGGFGMNGALCHSGQNRSDLEGLAAGAGQKSEAACSASAEIPCAQ